MRHSHLTRSIWEATVPIWRKLVAAAPRMIGQAPAPDMLVMEMVRSSPLRPPSLTTLHHLRPIPLLPFTPRVNQSKSTPSKSLTPPISSSMHRPMTGPRLLRTKMPKAPRTIEGLQMTRNLDDRGRHQANFSSRLSQHLLTYQAPADKMTLDISPVGLGLCI